MSLRCEETSPETMQVEKEITTFGKRLVRTLTADSQAPNEPASVSESALRSFDQMLAPRLPCSPWIRINLTWESSEKLPCWLRW